MRRARFLEPAEAEVEEAVTYFDQQRDGLGDRFEQDLKRIVSVLIEDPQIGFALTTRVRKVRLRTFQYNIIYAFDAEELVVVAVAHHRRRPGYWRGRIASLARSPPGKDGRSDRAR